MSEFPIKVTHVDKLKESTRSHIPLLKALLFVLSFPIFINSTLFALPETKAKKVLDLASYKVYSGLLVDKLKAHRIRVSGAIPSSNVISRSSISWGIIRSCIVENSKNQTRRY